ncbi:hypothetical protein M432DRAFT_358103 [Thermoascus aurantiacus ATCC 26904]
MPSSRPYQITAAVFALLSAGHTFTARKWTNDPQFKDLSKVVKAYARAGWYQGSVFLLIMALINYRWSRLVPQGRLTDPVDRAIAALNTLLLWATAAWYTKNGIRDTGAVVGASGVLQAWAAFWKRS